MGKRFLMLLSILMMSSTGFIYQNCAPFESLQKTESLASNAVNDFTSSELSCRFIGGNALSTVLTNTLGLPEGDVAMLNEQGEPLKSNNCKSFNHQNGGRDCLYLSEYSNELSTQSCNTSTFRLVAQIYTNACAESLSQEENVNRLCPQGSDNYTTIHQAFTGRTPRGDEIQILKELSKEFEVEQEKMTAVCAAIGSSLASINSF